MSTIIKENSMVVFPEDRSEDSVGVGKPTQSGLTSLTITFPEIGEEEHTSEDEADLQAIEALQDEPSEPLKDVLKELGLDE